MSTYTKEFLQGYVLESTSFADLARKIGIAPVGSNTTNLKRCCIREGLDTSHFTGQAHRKGRPAMSKLPHDEVFIKRSIEHGRYRQPIVRRALLESGVEYECVLCGNRGEWNGEPLHLQLDHINGQFWDNTKENLRFLCPNCHSQTENWGNKKPKACC